MSENTTPDVPKAAADAAGGYQNLQNERLENAYDAGYQQAVVGEQKSRIVAGILGILLGSLGIHRFYLGFTKIGVIQLIVSIVTFGIGGIWGFIEGIMILVKADPFKTDANGVPLKDS